MKLWQKGPPVKCALYVDIIASGRRESSSKSGDESDYNLNACFICLPITRLLFHFFFFERKASKATRLSVLLASPTPGGCFFFFAPSEMSLCGIRRNGISASHSLVISFKGPDIAHSQLQICPA
jgi:hypothetical protein